MQRTMNTKTSMVADTSGDGDKIEQTAVHSKDTVSRDKINMYMIQNLLLIWLDSNIDNNRADCRNTITQLRHVVDSINTFTDVDQCVDFLTDNSSENVCMIISGALCQNLVPLIHDVTQLHSVFIFCENKTRDELWAKDWSKIKAVCTEILPLCEVLKQAAQQCEQNAMPISFMPTRDDLSKKKLDQLGPSFMYTQILKEILLTIKFEQQHITEFIHYCREVHAKNQSVLKYVKQLKQKYHDETPVWWYTYDGFLYSMLNRALRLMDIDIILKLGFFIADLHRHVEQLHNEQFGDNHSSKSLTVYRGQGVSKADFEQLKKTKGGLISFDNFLSTSQNRDVSLLFAESNQSNPDLVGIVFVMTIDSSKSSAPFASINSVSYFQVEDEVLFSMHTVFRISDIKPMDENQHLFQVDLTLTSDNDKDLRLLTDHIRKVTEGSTECDTLGRLLYTLGETEGAQKFYQRLLIDVVNESEKGQIYHMLGLIKTREGHDDEAIIAYEKSLEIQQQSLPSNHPDLGTSYHNIGVVYDKMGEYSKALSFYEKAFEIQQQALPPNHPDLAVSYNNTASVYDKMGEYSKALSFYEKTLEIQQQVLPPNHPYLGSSYNNIGVMYRSVGEYSKALSFYEKALEIQQQSLPPNHPDLGSSYNNIGVMYRNVGEYSKALSFYEKALEIQQESLPPNHPDFAMAYNNIGGVYRNMGEYSKALSFYKKAVEIQQELFPPNHPDLGGFYNNIGVVYENMGEYSNALSSYEKALEIRQQSLPPNHPDLAMSYNNTGSVYDKMGEYSKALSSYEKALEIQQEALPPNHPDLGSSYNNIGVIYRNMGEYSKALSLYETALEIRQQSLPPKHPDLGSSYNNIGGVYYNMGEYSKALSFYEKALEIQQQAFPQNHPYLAVSYNNIGVIYHTMSKYSKALLFYEKALEIRQEALPPNHPYLGGFYNNIGVVYDNMDEYPKALSFYEKALEIQQESLPPNHPDFAMSYNNIGGVYRNMGEYSKALSFYKRTIDIGQHSLPSNHPHLNKYRKNLYKLKKKL